MKRLLVTASLAASRGRGVRPSRATVVIAGDARLFIDRLRKAYPQVEVVAAPRLDLDAIGAAPSVSVAR